MRQLKITNKITSRESVALDKYLSDIGKIDLLTSEDEANLARRIKEGDTEALDTLTRSNLRFVVSVAKQYQNHGLSLSDLINEGNVGLMKAAKRFDESKGFKFISYAVWWIRQSIIQAIVEYSRMVRIPLHKMNMYTKVNEAFLSFVQEFEREPTIEELAELLNMAPLDVSTVLAGAGNHLSVDAPLTDDEGSISMLDTLTHGDEESPDLRLMEQSLRDEIKYGMSSLSPREIQILSAYFGIDQQKPLNLEEIGDLYALTRERVRQIKDRALRRLRKNLIANNPHLNRSF
ncbi:MAG: RNA polymerase sigma factor RpoD/SigA [Saprospiraceae bacterium]|nr:RNA polymerase sigma factor RpoD/SigA [Saprospiraceae bacterium]